tara:strand:- start:273 stop:2084 length:1812 start_codon:yes stop_codon:yes gene_type:complete
MPKKVVPIRYTDRDFSSIKRSLIEHIKRYYPETFQDFNEASFGALMLDMMAYVGDVMSFYLDYQANESFMHTAIEYDNIIKLAKQLGYKFREAPSSTGIISFYIVVPAKATGFGPDPDYIPVLKKGTELANNAGVGFLLNEDVDFARSNNEIVVARADTDTGSPLSYAIKAFGQVVSGRIFEEVLDIGTFERLRRVQLSGRNITEIISVIDAEGHEYFEVDYLSQDVIYKEIINPQVGQQDGETMSGIPTILLRPTSVPRRFITEIEDGLTFLQFGYGSEDSLTTDPVTRASEVVLKTHGKNYSTSQAFDPSNLKLTDKLGVAPSNTTLRVTYRMNTANNVNAATNTVNNITNPIFRFSKANLLPNKVGEVIQSIQSTNEEPILGDVTGMTGEEIKRHAIDAYASQNRAVTAQDYVSVVYRMPAKYGKVKRCTIVQDPDSLKRNLNLYVISTDYNDRFIETNITIKDNLKFWIQDYKMINDTIDILDAKVVNIGVNFVVMAESDFDKYEVLEACRAELGAYFSDHFEIGEPLYMTRLYKMLGNVRGVLDVVNIKISNKTGSKYSSTFFDIDRNMSDDGRMLFVPQDHVLEVRYRGLDIVGVCK